MSDKGLIKKFLFLSVLSAIGNSCADWALFFYALNKSGFGESSGLSNASLFYVGFGIGRMLLAPLLGVLFDRFPKKIMSVIVDGSYAALLVVAAVLFKYNELNDIAFLVVTILIHTFSQIHMQSVGFSAVKKHAPQHGGRYLAMMFALSTGIGVATSGILFSLLGFYGCMAFAIVTFVPIILLYLKLFDGEEELTTQRTYFSDFVESFNFLLKDKVLLKFGAILGLFNVVGALFPAYLKLKINETIVGDDYLSAPILAGGLVIVTLFYKKMDIGSGNLRAKSAFSFAFLPILIALVLAYFYPSVLTLSLLYFSACFGSGLRNIITGNLRTSRVPKEKISRVNTLYGSLLNLGPLVGGLFVIPIVETEIKTGLLVAIGLTTAAIILSLLLLPKEKVVELSREGI